MMKDDVNIAHQTCTISPGHPLGPEVFFSGEKYK